MQTSYKSFKLKQEVHPQVTKSSGYNRSCENISFKYTWLLKYHLQKFDVLSSRVTRCNFFVFYLAIFQISSNCHKKLQRQNFRLQDMKALKITWKILLLHKPSLEEEIMHKWLKNLCRESGYYEEENNWVLASLEPMVNIGLCSMKTSFRFNPTYHLYFTKFALGLN